MTVFTQAQEQYQRENQENIEWLRQQTADLIAAEIRKAERDITHAACISDPL